MTEAPLVIKVGGNDLSHNGFVGELAECIAELSRKQPCIIIHGGGRMVDSLLDKLRIEPHYVNGQRVTDHATLDVVEMVLSGQVCWRQGSTRWE